MDEISRREFIKQSAATSAAAAFLPIAAREMKMNPLDLPIGSQTWPHRERIKNGDFAGLCRDMAALGIGLAADWVAAVKGGPASGGNFIDAANCAEAIALAQAAIRYSRKTFRANHCAPALLWNAEKMEFTNASDANQYLRREYRDGWTLTSGEV